MCVWYALLWPPFTHFPLALSHVFHETLPGSSGKGCAGDKGATPTLTVVQAGDPHLVGCGAGKGGRIVRVLLHAIVSAGCTHSYPGCELPHACQLATVRLGRVGPNILALNGFLCPILPVST